MESRECDGALEVVMITTVTNLEQMKQAIEAFKEISEFHFQAMETLLLIEGREDKMEELKALIKQVRDIVHSADKNLNSNNAAELLIHVMAKNDTTLENILGMSPEEYLPKLTILRKALGSPK